MDSLSVGPLLLKLSEDFPAATPAREHRGREKLEELLAESWVTRPAAEVALREWLDRFGRWPTTTQIESVLRSTRADIRLADHDAAIAACIKRFGHDFLALGAIPWSTPCVACLLDDVWQDLGGDPDGELVRHVHIDDEKTLAPVLTIGEHQTRLYLGWTGSTLRHSSLWAQEHNPDGSLVAPPQTYNPLRANMHPAEWARRVAIAGPKRAARGKAMVEAFLGRGLKVKAACGFCGDRKTQPVYAEVYPGKVDPNRVDYYVACEHCTPASALEDLL